jgi:hypothetical protein
MIPFDLIKNEVFKYKVWNGKTPKIILGKKWSDELKQMVYVSSSGLSNINNLQTLFGCEFEIGTFEIGFIIE